MTRQGHKLTRRFVFDGRAIARRRGERTQRELARSVGITQAHVSRLENSGCDCGLLTFADLAAALGCTPGELLSECLKPNRGSP